MQSCKDNFEHKLLKQETGKWEKPKDKEFNVI